MHEKAPLRWTSVIWSHSLSDIFLKLYGGYEVDFVGNQSRHTPLVSENTSVVDKDSNSTERIDSGFDDSSAVGDR